MKHFCEQRANEKQQRLDSWRGCLYINHLSYPRILTFFIEWLRFYFWSHDWWKPRIPEVKTKNTSWIIIIHQSPLCVQNLNADIGDFGECVQTPIARRFAPNVCSALARPGACSQPRYYAVIFLLNTYPDHAYLAKPSQEESPEEHILGTTTVCFPLS